MAACKGARVWNSMNFSPQRLCKNTRLIFRTWMWSLSTDEIFKTTITNNYSTTMHSSLVSTKNNETHAHKTSWRPQGFAQQTLRWCQCQTRENQKARNFLHHWWGSRGDLPQCGCWMICYRKINMISQTYTTYMYMYIYKYIYIYNPLCISPGISGTQFYSIKWFSHSIESKTSWFQPCLVNTLTRPNHYKIRTRDTVGKVFWLQTHSL